MRTSRRRYNLQSDLPLMTLVTPKAAASLMWGAAASDASSPFPPSSSRNKSESKKKTLNRVSRAVLRRRIVAHYNESELRDLCFDLYVDYESLPGQGKGDKARELVAYIERHGRIVELVQALDRQRPSKPGKGVQ